MSILHSSILSQRALRRACLALACTLLATPVAAAQFSLFLDTDRNAATGCGATTPQSTPLSGVEYRVDLSIGAVAPNRVDTLSVSKCQAGVFGPPVAQPAGFPVGQGNGVDGADVVEIELALAAVGLSGQEIVDVTVVGNAPVSGESVTRLPGLNLATGQLVTQAPIAVPTLAPVASLLLAIALLLIGVRYAPARSTMAVMLAVLVGTVVAQTLNRFVADGQINDWAGYSPATTRPAGSASPLTEVRQVFLAVAAPSLFVRLDITETIETAVSPQGKIERLDANGPNRVTSGHAVRIKAAFVVDGVVDTGRQITWSQADGPAVSFDPKGPDLVFTAPVVTSETNFTFFAEATDDGGDLFITVWLMTVEPGGISFVNQVNTGQTTVTSGAQNSHTEQQVGAGAAVSLTTLASGSGGAPVVYAWTQVSGTPVTLTGSNQQTATFTAPSGGGKLVFEVKATDPSTGASATQVQTVVVKGQGGGGGQPPLQTQQGVSHQVYNGHGPITLTAATQGGTPPFTYAWVQTKGPAATISGTTSAQVQVTPPTVGTDTDFEWQVTVTDQKGQAAVVTHQVSVKAQPTLEARIIRPNGCQLSCLVEEGDKLHPQVAVTGGTGNYSYIWSTSYPRLTLTNPNGASPSFTVPNVDSETPIFLEVSVSDGFKTVKDNITFAAKPVLQLALHQNQTGSSLPTGPGTANHTNNQVESGKAFHPQLNLLTPPLTGGATLTYRWEVVFPQPVPPGLSIAGANTATPIVSSPPVNANTPVLLQATITYASGTGKVVTKQADSQFIAVPATAPTRPVLSLSMAGHASVYSGHLVSPRVSVMNAAGPLTYQWRQLNGPTVSLAGATTATPSFTAPNVSGHQDIAIEVEVGDGASVATAQLTVAVDPVVAPPKPPLSVTASPDASVPANSTVQPRATVLHSFGTLGYRWTETTATGVVILDATTATPSFVAPATASTVTLSVQATDSQNGSATDTVTYQVQPALRVTAGPPDRAASEGDTVDLLASVQNASGPVSYAWTVVDAGGTGVGTGNITNAGSQNASLRLPSVNGDKTIKLQLSASDSANTARAIVTVHVQDRHLAVDLGADRDLPAKQTTFLHANVSSGLAPYTYAWTEDSRAPLNKADPANPSLTAPATSHTLQLNYTLQVTDSLGNTAIDSIALRVLADPIVVSAGSDFIVKEGTSQVRLQATVQNANAPTYRWTQTKGTPVSLSSTTIADPTFNAPALAAATNEDLEFAVEVTSDGQVKSDRVTVTVQGVPDLAVQVTSALQVVEGATVSLPGHVIGAGATVTQLEWLQLSPVAPRPALSNGLIVGNNRDLTATFTAPAYGTANQYVFQFKATGTGNVDTGQTVVNVIKTPSVSASVSAGNAHRVRSGSTVTLQATGHSLQAYTWAQVAGSPTVALTGAGTATPSFTAPDVTADTTLTFRVTAIPLGGGTPLTDTVDVFVYRPTILVNNVGATTFSLTEGDPARGVVSTFTDSTTGNPVVPATFSWVITPTPPAGVFSGTSTSTLVINPIAKSSGTYHLEIIAGNSAGHFQAGRRQYVVTIAAPVKLLPPPLIVDAGADFIARERTAGVQLQATVQNGNAPTYQWTQTKGAAVTLSDATIANPTFSAPSLAPGTNAVLEFKVTVGSNGESRSDLVAVTVQGQPDLSVQVTDTLQVVEGTSVSLPGHVVDANPGSPAKVERLEWTQVSPASPGLALSNGSVTGDNRNLTAVFTAPAFGAANQYVFQFKATGTGNVDTAQTVVNVIPTPSVSASVSAGGTRRVRSGSTVTLQATGHSLQAYSWRQVGGSPTVVLSGANTATPSFTAPNVSADTTLLFRVEAAPLGGGALLNDEVDVVIFQPSVVVNNSGPTRITLLEGDPGKDLTVSFTDNLNPPSPVVPATINWIITPPPPAGVFSGTNTKTLTINPTTGSKNTYNVVVVAGDSVNHYQSGVKQFTVIVNPVPPPLPSAASVSAKLVETNKSLKLTALTAAGTFQLHAPTIAGGVAPLSYQWKSTSTPAISFTGASASTDNPTVTIPAPQADCTYVEGEVVLTVTDAAGQTVDAKIPWKVTRIPEPIACHLCRGPKFICERSHAAQKCSLPEHQFCINDVENLRDGSRYVTRRCATAAEVNREWLGNTRSDGINGAVTGCIARDGSVAYDVQNLVDSHFQCTFACTGANCNIETVPTQLAVPSAPQTQYPEFAPGQCTTPLRATQ